MDLPVVGELGPIGSASIAVQVQRPVAEPSLPCPVRIVSISLVFRATTRLRIGPVVAHAVVNSDYQIESPVAVPVEGRHLAAAPSGERLSGIRKCRVHDIDRQAQGAMGLPLALGLEHDDRHLRVAARSENDLGAAIAVEVARRQYLAAQTHVVLITLVGPGHRAPAQPAVDGGRAVGDSPLESPGAYRVA